VAGSTRVIWHQLNWHRCRTIFLFGIALTVAAGAYSEQASSQVQPLNQIHFQVRPRHPNPPTPADAPMLVQADEIKYDYPNNTVAAVGNVQIYYGGATIEADEVIYDQKDKRLRAQGNARLTEPNGQITYGQVIDLTDDYRDGFVDSLRLETPDDTHLAAVRADREKGAYTVLENGVYTACEPCKDDPNKPPLWQVKAARIIHDENEKMLYFENATVDFFGVPLAWFPFMSAPDPTVKRKSGFLFPSLSNSQAYGYGIEVPYYLALAPNYDLTLYPKYTTMQGPLMEAEWSQRLLSGSFNIHAAGIFQQDSGYFAGRDGIGAPSTQSFRGAVLTSGQFALTDSWVWGWTGFLQTDPTFTTDYGLSRLNGVALDPFHTGTDVSTNGALGTEGISQLYLAGRGDRSYFDIRSIYYYGDQLFDGQAQGQGQLPVVAPVLDYSNVAPHQVMGGELSYKFNLTSLTRQDASFDAISQTAVNDGICASGLPNTADPALLTKANCLLRGIPGDYTRGSAEVDWRRTLTTNNGQQITPFFSLRGDVASVDIDNQPGVSNYITTGASELGRVMPTAGVEYRYPFVDVEPWGTQTIQPIAQLILRPNETEIGKWPNEDSQSLVFDDTSLFKVDKFSGWDRVEGGGRANVGFDYTAQVNGAGSFNALFGQSYQLFGLNSYSAGDITNTGLDSGLDKTVSDYVGRVAYMPNSTYMFEVRGRFDQATFAVERLEFETVANFDRVGLHFIYGDYAAQPALGFLTEREGITAGASFKLTPNWVLVGSAQYDIFAQQFSAKRIGIGYVDDCLLLSFNYSTSYTYNGTTSPIPNNSFLFQMSLRTLGSDALNSGSY
jgi:LPS-assembly protein